jgi:hypothetical protein
MNSSNPCLVIIFNHRYDKNIAILEKLYSNRFDNIFFLVPFYDGANPRVIPVYESSFYFQGYIAQGFKLFYRPEFTHYIFIGDDLILNPLLNQDNYAELIGLNQYTSYAPELVTLDGRVRGLLPKSERQQPEKQFWTHAIEAVTFYSNRKGSETQKELPTYEDAIKKFKQAGIEIKPIKYKDVFGPIKYSKDIQVLTKLIKSFWTYFVAWRHLKVPGHRNELKLEYPLVYGYSDVVIVSSLSIERFCQFCGVFSSMGLFVEMAIPTALVLTGGHIITDQEAKLYGEALWGEDIATLEKKHNLSLDNMLNDFPVSQLYYHPIKLSRWH